jgi:hypothetical protein
MLMRCLIRELANGDGKSVSLNAHIYAVESVQERMIYSAKDGMAAKLKGLKE